MTLDKFLLLIQIAATFFMTGVIWYVQVVHYPLFDRVGTSSFAQYEANHCRLTTFVVAPAMVIEAFAAVLFIGVHPPQISTGGVMLGAAAVFLIWISTALLSVPYHEALSTGFSSAAYSALCGYNWIRTAAWTARSGLLVWWLVKLLP